MSNGLCATFPGNVIPKSLMDPAELHAISLLPVLNSCEDSTCSTANGLFNGFGSLPADGHFSINASTLGEFANFGGFIQIPEVGAATRSTKFSLYVDGNLISTSDVSYTVLQPSAQ